MHEHENMIDKEQSKFALQILNQIFRESSLVSISREDSVYDRCMILGMPGAFEYELGALVVWKSLFLTRLGVYDADPE